MIDYERKSILKTRVISINLNLIVAHDSERTDFGVTSMLVTDVGD